MLIMAVLKKDRPEGWIYQEKKIPKQFMITQSASDAIDVIAKKLGISRSEVIERAARCGGMDKARNLNSESGECNQ